MKRILLAAGLIAASSHLAQAEQWWLLSRSDTSNGVLDSCISQAPAEGFARLYELGYAPHYEDHVNEVDVVYRKLDGHQYAFAYFRYRGYCLSPAQGNIEENNKYR
jgi:hypothetical protein